MFGLLLTRHDDDGGYRVRFGSLPSFVGGLGDGCLPNQKPVAPLVEV